MTSALSSKAMAATHEPSTRRAMGSTACRRPLCFMLLAIASSQNVAISTVTPRPCQRAGLQVGCRACRHSGKHGQGAGWPGGKIPACGSAQADDDHGGRRCDGRNLRQEHSSQHGRRRCQRRGHKRCGFPDAEDGHRQPDQGSQRQRRSEKVLRGCPDRHVFAKNPMRPGAAAAQKGSCTDRNSRLPLKSHQAFPPESIPRPPQSVRHWCEALAYRAASA